MCTAVYKDFFHAGVGEELERVLDERGIREGQKTLTGVSACDWCICGYAYSWVFEGEGTEAGFEGIREYLQGQHVFANGRVAKTYHSL